MHRMRHFVVLTGWFVASTTLFALPASATLYRAAATPSFADLSADINGQVRYTYDSSVQKGIFNVTNTPYLIAGGPTAAQEFTIQPNADGVRRQVLTIALDADGAILADDPANNYELWGTIVTPNQTFSGLLLKGTPIAFGYQDLDSVGIPTSDVFDAALNITGGELQSYFGTDTYIRIAPELESTFHDIGSGTFTQDFSGVKATSNTRTYNAPFPFPIPEPTTVVLLLAGGTGLVFRRQRRARTS